MSKATTAVRGQTFKKLPAVASFTRGHVISDGAMFSVLSDGTEVPVGIFRDGIRGPQNVNDGLGNVTQKKNGVDGERGVQQVLQTEIAKLDDDAEAMIVRFGLAMLDVSQGINMCSDSGDVTEAKRFQATIEDFLARAKRSKAIEMLALRYARNIANGRWLWRNRTFAHSIIISVASRNGKLIAAFDAKKVPTNHFDRYTADEKKLGEAIAAQMMGTSTDCLLVEAKLHMLVPGAIVVFPSENFVEKDKGREDTNEKCKSLYKSRSVKSLGARDNKTNLVGYAAIRDHKIWNALRTIDTWYPDYEERGVPIPIEPLGASMQDQEFFRKGPDSSFEMFRSLAVIDPESVEGLYCLACVERGGVYGPAKPKKEKIGKAPSADEGDDDAPSEAATAAPAGPRKPAGKSASVDSQVDGKTVSKKASKKSSAAATQLP